MRRPLKLQLLWALLGASVAVAVFVLMVRFHLGQRVDFSAFEGRKWMSLEMRRSARAVVSVGTPMLVVAVAARSTVVALTRRGLGAAAAALASVPVALVLARMLKNLLPRDDQLVGSWVTGDNTFPSGHLAVLATAVLVAVSVSTPRRRPRVAALAAGLVAAQAVGVAASGWHRPSDLVGALGIAVGVSALAGMVIAGGRRGGSLRPRERWYVKRDSVLHGGGAILLLVWTWFVVGRLLGRPSYGDFLAHVAAVSLVVVLGYASVVVHARLADAADDAATLAGPRARTSRPPESGD